MKNKNEEYLHSFLDKLYNSLDVKVNTDSGLFKDVYGYKILSKTCLLRTITQSVDENYPLDMIENDKYKMFNRIIFIVIPDFVNGKKLDMKRIKSILDKNNIKKILKKSKEDTSMSGNSEKKSKKDLKTSLKILHKKDFKIIELQMSKIKIASRNERSLNMLLKKIGKRITSYSGVKFKKEKKEKVITHELTQSKV